MVCCSTRVAGLVLACIALAIQPGAAASHRSLLQTSTSGSCPGVIPGCMPGRCSLQVVAGRQQSICERCNPSFIPSKNGLQCICPPGKYLLSGACAKCGYGFFCKGGSMTADNDHSAAADVGIRQSCVKGVVNSTDDPASVAKQGLTTKTELATRYTDCVPMPGWYLSATTEVLQQADVCPPLSYSPGNNRIRGCFKCQSGTAENPGMVFANTALQAQNGNKTRSNRVEVCQVPPGRYLVQNVVRVCPMGTFRTSFSQTNEESAKICFACPPGITTNTTAATNQSACNVVGPGVSINSTQLAAAQDLAAQAATGVSLNGSSADLTVAFNPNLCDYGTYFGGGVVAAGSSDTCQKCPDGSTTQQRGSTSINDCMVPPGYYINTSNQPATLRPCPNTITLSNGLQAGFYRSGWVTYQSPAVRDSDGQKACTKCGDNILSNPRDIDESNGGNSSAALVAASAYSCYIEPGMGITVTGQVDNTTSLMAFRAEVCANNSYGVENRTYGLISAPCKPCQRNLITLGPGASNMSQCVNPDGYGYDTTGGTPCPQGYYASAGSLLPCTPCPPGRTTLANPANQVSITDCLVDTGKGVFDGDWVPDSTLTPAQQANLTALPCPIGYYGAGGALNGTCQLCPDNKSTQQEGSILDDCTVCKPGYALVTGQNGNTTCQICSVGKWSDGINGCTDCPKTSFLFISSKRKEDTYVSSPYTIRKGATGPEECVPQAQQFGIDIGQKVIDDSFYSVVSQPAAGNWYDTARGPNATECASACPANQCCFARLDYYAASSGGNIQNTCKTTGTTTANTFTVNSVADSAWNGVGGLMFTKLVFADTIAAASIGQDDTTDASASEPSASTTADDQVVRTKAMSSGLYARCDIPTGANVTLLGKSLGQPMLVTDSKSLQACKSKCDMMSTCWGFPVTGTPSSACTPSSSTGCRFCQLRGGEDQINSRGLFANPTAANWPVTGLNWY